jgi:hypothetical protein
LDKVDEGIIRDVLDEIGVDDGALGNARRRPVYPRRATRHNQNQRNPATNNFPHISHR